MPRALPLMAMLALLPLHIGAMCEGWQLTPEARMACCEAAARCAMHEPPPETLGHGHAEAQTDADACCARSEPANSGERGVTYAPPVAETSMLAAYAIHAGSSATAYPRHPAPPPPRGHVPKHVLLSVFLL